MNRPNDTRGFSLIELLVAFAVTLAVTGGALTLALSSRKLYTTDVARTHLNQSLRAAKDFLVVDIRQAGERLPSTFPVIEIVRGEDLPGGAAGDPDEMIVRRNLTDTILRSCKKVDGGQRKIYVADGGGSPPPGCVPVPDGNGDGWPDNHEVFHEYRLSQGAMIGGEHAVSAYLYNPTTGQGEFFTYWKDDVDDAYIQTPPGQHWAFDYPVADNCQVFLLEERRYRLDDGILQVVVNQAAATALNMVDGIEDFQVRARFRTPPPPAPQDEPPAAESFGFGDDWTALRAIEIGMAGRIPAGDRFVERRWSSEILPRNVLSR